MYSSSRRPQAPSHQLLISWCNLKILFCFILFVCGSFPVNLSFFFLFLSCHGNLFLLLKFSPYVFISLQFFLFCFVFLPFFLFLSSFLPSLCHVHILIIFLFFIFLTCFLSPHKKMIHFSLCNNECIIN